MIELREIITIAVVFGGFVGNAFYLKGVFSAQIQSNRKDIDDLRDTVRYKDTCNAMFKGHERRIYRIEKRENAKAAT